MTNLAELCWLINEFWLSQPGSSGQTVDEHTMRHGVSLMMQSCNPICLRRRWLVPQRCGQLAAVVCFFTVYNEACL